MYKCVIVVHGNELTGPAGEVASPLYPKPYIQQGDFFWRITVDNGMTIRITFTDFYMDHFDTSECYIFLQVIFLQWKIYDLLFNLDIFVIF